MPRQNELRSWRNISQNYSTIKGFAFQVLDAFDQMARPEIQNVVMKKIWDYVKSYSARIIFKKPDSELEAKLKQIHTILNPLFTKVDNAKSISESYKLGSPKLIKTASTKDIIELSEALDREAASIGM